ncbi:MAG TPA: hydroxyacylglutathione hydrolase [Chiayiivirga sp.]|nr:hydroxyacylglutathione hydrolase [Chiayiivirga sp.]
MPLPTALPALADNYIWALAGTNGRAVIVDPGEAAPVLEAMEQGLRPCAILVTHHHRDHTGAVDALAERCGAIVYAPDDPRIAGDCVRVGEGDVVNVAQADLSFSVMAVPGHTRSHIAFAGEGLVFTGDTLFSLGCGRLFEGTPAQMFDSLERIAALPPETRVCCGHEYTLGNAAFALTVDPGNLALVRRAAQAREARALGNPTVPISIGSEQDTNPFLRCREPRLAARVAEHGGCDAADPVAVFAALRRWKDGFAA